MKLARIYGCALLLSLLASSALAAIGDSRIARWKDDKTATFLLMFDDSWPSHWMMALPAMTARNITGTFYINPAKGEYVAYRSKWENEMWQAGMVYGNHTMTHNGIIDAADAEYEVGGCTNEILRIVPGKSRRLISWATPGVSAGQWNISQSELQALWSNYNLVDRPTFVNHGAVYHLQTTQQMLTLADNAIATGGMEYLIIHGVERRAPYYYGYQDFWALNYDIFTAVLDGLKDRRDAGNLWITDHISYVKYQAERDAATLRILEASNQRILLDLTSTTDSELYDAPLTLITQVPTNWTQAWVTQAGATKQYPVTGGSLLFEAVPNAGDISVVPEPAALGPLLAGAGLLLSRKREPRRNRMA